MSRVKKLAYTYVHPIWQAPSGKQYQIIRYELRRQYELLADEVAVLRHYESDVLLLRLLKNELAWCGDMQRPLTPADWDHLRALEHAFCLTYHGVFIK